MPTKNKVILAVDPGFDRIGIAILSQTEDTPVLIHSECFKTKRKNSRDVRLLELGSQVKKVIEKWHPSVLAIETLFFNTNITSAMGVAEARGIIIYESKNSGLRVYEYSPQAIKIAVTSYGRADKIQMASMIKKMIALPAKTLERLDDEIDAIAIGITHLASVKD